MHNILFNQLDHWHTFPNYQLERRADIFFAIHLPEILKRLRGIDVELIIPEFPVRIGTIYPAIETDKSYKIDYVVKVKNEARVVFIELKTDSGSRRDAQDAYLDASKAVGFRALLEGLGKIYRATTYKKKYRALIADLVNVGLVTFEKNCVTVPSVEYESEVLYIQPRCRDGESGIGFDEIAEVLSTSVDPITIRFCQSLRLWAKN